MPNLQQVQQRLQSSGIHRLTVFDNIMNGTLTFFYEDMEIIIYEKNGTLMLQPVWFSNVQYSIVQWVRLMDMLQDVLGDFISQFEVEV